LTTGSGKPTPLVTEIYHISKQHRRGFLKVKNGRKVKVRKH
jgi:hypothetical protein